MKRILLLFILACSSILLKAQSLDDSPCRKLIDRGMYCYDDTLYNDSTFHFLYYKNNEVAAFWFVMGAKQELWVYSGKNDTCEVIEVDKKYIAEVLLLRNSYNQWVSTFPRNESDLPPPPGTTWDSIFSARKKADWCNGYAYLDNSGNRITATNWLDDWMLIGRNKDAVGDKLLEDLIAFARKISKP